MARWSPSIQDIVERQVTAWEVERRRQREVEEQDVEEWPRIGEGPWLAISRQPGTGAGEVGRELAKRLSWKFYDRELMTEIAARIDIPEAFIERFDEHTVGLLDEFIVRPAVPGDPGQMRFLLGLIAVIRQLGRRGRAVLVGRGASFILDPRFGVRVRVIGDWDARVANIAARRGLSVREAARVVRDLDRERRGFIRQVFGKDIEDPGAYDAVLNITAIGPEATMSAMQSLVQVKINLAQEKARQAGAGLSG